MIGRSQIPTRGGGDFDLPIGKLVAVPQRDAVGLLRQAPSVFLQNEGSPGHPYAFFMRGFNAREGQDIEMQVDGIPVNEPGNIHGAGSADPQFVIPELVRRIRVIEGPFAPQQGNFGVAGSIHFDLGVENPGFTAKVSAGSFATRRLLLLWRPETGSERTFAGGEIFATDGFGANRASQRASVMGSYEGRIGASLSWRVLVTSYANHYQQAGVVREDDVLANRTDFYGTYERGQDGDSARHSIGLVLSDKLGNVRLRQETFGIVRDMRIRDNFTGFLEDPRGDTVEQTMRSGAVGARGSARLHGIAFGEKQEIELGYFTRYDAVDSTQQRDVSGTTTPYLRELDLSSGLTSIALWSDASIKPRSWLTLRGGVRADLFHTTVTDKAAPETATNVASAFQPRATLLLGPYRDVTVSSSVGQAARSFAPQDIIGNRAPPIGTATSWEAGIAYNRTLDATEFKARSIFFATWLDHDLLFDETTGRSTLGPASRRTGWSGWFRATGSFFDLAASATFSRATQEATQTAVPLAPPIVIRGDATLFADLPRPVISGRMVRATLGIGATYVGRRPLESAAMSADYVLLDAGGSLRWRWVEIGVSVTNLLDQRYRVGEFNYVSNFRLPGENGTAPVRHFVAGEPLSVLATLALTM